MQLYVYLYTESAVYVLLLDMTTKIWTISQRSLVFVPTTANGTYITQFCTMAYILAEREIQFFVKYPTCFYKSAWNVLLVIKKSPCGCRGYGSYSSNYLSNIFHLAQVRNLRTSNDAFKTERCVQYESTVYYHAKQRTPSLRQPSHLGNYASGGPRCAAFTSDGHGATDTDMSRREVNGDVSGRGVLVETTCGSLRTDDGGHEAKHMAETLTRRVHPLASQCASFCSIECLRGVRFVV